MRSLATHGSHPLRLLSTSVYLSVHVERIDRFDANSYLQTLPFELRMWKSAWKSRQLTCVHPIAYAAQGCLIVLCRLSFTLFLLIRYPYLASSPKRSKLSSLDSYTSILVLTISNFGFFYSQ
jgi:hypothetical protein